MFLIFQYKQLYFQLVKRDVLLRYRGAYLGLVWIFLNPLIMLGIFTFVFSQIFQARWPEQTGNIPFALNLFCGLIVFNIFGEAVGRAPASIKAYPNYVKKIIFPVEILPLVPFGSTLIHSSFSLLILFLALIWTENLYISQLLFPLLLLPIFLVVIGATWFLSAWGVFIKDMSQIVPVCIQMLMFLSPVFYPSRAVPESLQPIYTLNPISTVIEAFRAAMSGSIINWSSWSISLFTGLLVFVLGYVCFNKSRDEFADVL